MSAQRDPNEFFDFLEGKMSADDARTFTQQLDSDKELAASLERCKILQRFEREIAAGELAPRASFAERVCRRVKEASLWQKLLNIFCENDKRRAAFGALATFATLIIIVRVTFDPEVQREALLPIPAPQQNGMTIPEGEKQASSALPVETQASPAAHLPPRQGMRASTIEIDARAGIEGWAAPGTRVDTVLTYMQDGQMVSKIIAQNARVLSYGGSKNATKDGMTSPTITVEVNPADALKIQTAKKLGRLSLMMRSPEDSDPTAVMEMNATEIKGGKRAPKKYPSSGVMRIDGKEYVIAQDGSINQMRNLDGTDSEGGGGGPAIAYQRNYNAQPQQTAASNAPQRYMPPTNERYEAHPQNDWQDSQRQPLSTFSLDTDTASYANVRRYLRQGQFPPREAVRIEDFINYFDYDYPKTDGEKFKVAYEAAPSPFNSQHHLLRIGVRTDAGSRGDRPWNLVFLIDTSGSMVDSDKLPLAKQALKTLVNQMRSSDRLSIVTYSGFARSVISGSTIGARAHAIQQIEGLIAEGSTNGSDGLNLAYQEARRHYLSGGINRVILISDGDFNAGITSPDALVHLIESQRQSGVYLSAAGVGTGNLKDSTLEKLANNGNGEYYYLDSFQEAQHVFTQKLTQTVETVAKDVKFQVEFNPAHVLKYRLLGYENRSLAASDFVNDAKDAGEVGADRSVTVLYELILRGANSGVAHELRYQNKPADSIESAPASLPNEFAYLKVRFKDPESSQAQQVNYPFVSQAVKHSADEASSEFKFVSAVACFAELLRGNPGAAACTYTETLKLAEQNLGADPQGQRRELLQLIRTAQAIS